MRGTPLNSSKSESYYQSTSASFHRGRARYRIRSAFCLCGNGPNRMHAGEMAEMVEGAPLLREYGVKSSIEGSNPSLSAILLFASLKLFSYHNDPQWVIAILSLSQAARVVSMNELLIFSCVFCLSVWLAVFVVVFLLAFFCLFC